ncbi:hypothetical protein DP939_17505 [Spongiactinospora rosea]|uniref:Uncharacterized protein n=1 Tax=Spongiactinospora rosea TaxID=2248750 RepID=A0A366M0M4_9ACTN|nr:hypothetical protein [Spongiactinospora rosea]RBQ18982.1 hypothetical protein DP939_17505 [Spongiactinospora rosea]
MLRRTVAATVAAAALGAFGLATAAPAAADSPVDVGQTQLSFDAGPEPIHKGRTLYLRGKLKVQCSDDYVDGLTYVIHSDSCDDQERWHRLGWKEIDILFQPKGSYRWHHVESVRTRGDGSFSTSVRARWSGTWRAVFDGARHLAPSEASDYVKVYGGHRYDGDPIRPGGSSR